MKPGPLSKLRLLGRDVKRLQHRHHRSLDTALVALGTTLVQWDALRWVAQNPDASSHALAQLTFQTDQSFGALANRLVERKLITRTQGPGRAIHHRITPAGSAILKRGQEVVDALLEASFAPLSSSERETMQALLTKLLEDEP